MSHLPLCVWGGVLLGWHNLAKLTKYAGLAIFAIVIISIIILNIVASYSNTKTQAGAEPTATLATNVNGAASISLSIHSATDSCDTSTSANPAGDICMQIPDGGGLAVGRHTIGVTTNSYAGYSVTVEGSGSSTDMAASDFGSGTSSNNELIKSTSATIANPSTLSLNTWGIAIPGKSGYSNASTYELGITNPNDDNTQTTLATATFGSVPPKLAGEAIMSSNQATGTNHDGSSSDSQNIYYGANVEQFFRAGSYSEEVVYTATANLPAAPTNLAITPNQYEISSNGSSTVTITGNNLASTYRVWIDINNNGSYNTNEQCTNLSIESDTKLTCNVPTDQTIPALDTGTHAVYVQTQAEKLGEIDNGFTYTKSSVCRNADGESACQVDIDDNMIPVVYEDYDGNGGGNWRIVTKEEIESDPGSWYNYRSGQWANAITLRDDYEEGYFIAKPDEGALTFAPAGTEPSDPSSMLTPLQFAKNLYNGVYGSLTSAWSEMIFKNEQNLDAQLVLGYWVYIPRYAYEVQRRDAVDAPVSPQNFDIVFQTANQKNTPAPTLSTDSSHIDYRTSGISRTYVANSDNTTWATNPAFTWGDTELNGIWVGKFETTGKISAPTVKPNQHANISEYIGNFYLSAKSIGVNDPDNVGGGSSSTSSTGRPTLEDDLVQNSHNLSKATSHMLKNSEWGAITYLAHSKYGTGINTDLYRESNIQRNSAYPSSSADADGTSSRYGITGCGPAKANETSSPSTYTDGTPLSADVIESSTACSTDPELGAKRAYNGELGVLSSTTNTIHGVYGLSGGAGEYVMGNRTTSVSQTTSSTSYFETPAKSPYVDLYVATPNGPFGTNPQWPVGDSGSGSEYYYNYDVCTFETCGGTATYETTTVQSVSSYIQSWGGAYSYFVHSSNPWFNRGSNSSSSNANPFYTSRDDGFDYTGYGFRAALLALPAGQ